MNKKILYGIIVLLVLIQFKGCSNRGKLHKEFKTTTTAIITERDNLKKLITKKDSIINDLKDEAVTLRSEIVKRDAILEEKDKATNALNNALNRRQNITIVQKENKEERK